MTRSGTQRWLRGGFRFLTTMGLVGFAAAATGAQNASVSRGVVSVDEELSSYREISASDPVSKLQRELEAGRASLKFEGEKGYLVDVLARLGVPVSSQVLVFTKTSLQRPDISPRNPRAIYFNDEVYVAWVPGAELLEVSATDPVLGGVWYTLKQEQGNGAGFVRNDRCLECHVTSKTMGVPGHLARSNVPDENGGVGLLESRAVMDDRWPLEKRWGGWYVTGTPGTQHHLGNLFGEAALERHAADPGYLGNVTNLARFFEVGKYPEPHSDIVALLVLNHQIQMQNLITLLHYEANLHLARYGHVRFLKEMSRELLKYMLFVEEAALTDRVAGTSQFAEVFEAAGLCDQKGRTLRKFNLQTRLFEYPCSYLIYSDSFDALPEPVKKHLYHQLWNILSGEDEGTEFRRWPVESRQAIKEILIETKTDLPAYWTL